MDFETPTGWNEKKAKETFELVADLMPILGFRQESMREDEGYQRRDYINGE